MLGHDRLIVFYVGFSNGKETVVDSAGKPLGFP